jgi:hypothetical protein
MRLLKNACALLALIALTTCNGGVHSPTEPKNNIACDPAFNGQWSWVLQSCGAFTNGSSPAQLSTTNGCRLTLDTTPDAQKAMGQTYTLVVSFDNQTATLERKGTVCDAIDKGTIVSQVGREFGIELKPTATEKCCNQNYFVNIRY